MPLPRRSRPLSALAAVAATGLVIALAVGVHYRVRYGTFAAWGPPDRIAYCARSYLRGSTGPLSRAEILAHPAALPGDAPYPLQVVGHVTPSGREIMAAVTPPERRNAVTPPLPCAMEIFVAVGTDRYQPYTLSGGP